MTEKIDRPPEKGDKEETDDYIKKLVEWINRFYDAMLKS
jgi:hypothetical protein